MPTRREHIECAALIAEIVGAAAVVISVVYLGVQIAGNTRALQSEGHYNALQLAQRPLELLIADDGLAEVVNAGYTNPALLSAADDQRFAMYQVMAFNAWEYLYYAHAAESVPGNLWEGANAYYTELIRRNPGLTGFWQAHDHIYAEPFRSYVAGLLPTEPVESNAIVAAASESRPE
jgi:hypothetical protein